MRNDMELFAGYALQSGLGLVFLLSFVPKALRPNGFVRKVHDYGLLPRAAVPAFAFGLVAIGIAVGISLTLGAWGWVVRPASAVLLSIFTIAVAVNLRRGRQIDCGCFVGDDDAISRFTLLRLGIFVAVAVVVTLMQPPSFGDLVLSKELEFGYTILALVLGPLVLVLFGWVIELPRVLTLMRRKT